MARELLPGPGGVVVDDECLTLVDTRAVPWEPAPGAPGVWIRPLVRDASGAPLVYVEWRAPVAPGPSGAPVPRRHLHRTVGVRRFVLGGEGPTWEYESATQQHGDLLLLREGWYVDRDPGSIHGIEPAATTPVGITSLCWRTGSGTFPGEPSCAAETGAD